MIRLVLELGAVAAIVAFTVFGSLETSVTVALARAAESSREPVRDAAEVVAAAGRAGWLWAGGIAAMTLGRLLALRRRRSSVAVHLAMPAVALLTGLGLALQWGYFDPLSTQFWTGPAFAEGVFYGGLLAAAVMWLPWDPGIWALRLRWPVAVGAVAALVALAVFGTGPRGSGVKLSLFGFQPIEGVKLAFVVFLAAAMGRRAEHLRYQRERRGPIQIPRPGLLLPAVAILTVLFLGLWLVRDLGPTFILSLVFLAFYYAVTRSWAELALAALAVALMIAWIVADPSALLPDTVATRVEMWLDPWLNGREGGDQMVASLWAFAAGGPAGQGWGRAAFGVLPTGHTDLALAGLGEVAGLAGLLLYFGGLLALVLQGLWIGFSNRTPERMLLAMGLAVLLFAQWSVIFSGSAGILPLTGVVVPFLSHGKTGMIAFLALVAILVRLAVSARPAADRDELRQLRGGIAWVMVAVVALWVGAAAVAADRTVLDRSATLRGVLAMGYDDRVFLRHDPRLAAIARRIRRGEIHDRHGAPLAATDSEGRRAYPLGADLGTLLGPLDRRVQTPSWALEGLHDSRLRGLAPAAASELGVWIEQRPDRPDPETGKEKRVADRILFTVATDEYREEDHDRARAMLDPESTAFFTRLRYLDYSPLLPLARLRGEAREEAVEAMARDVPSRTVRVTLDAGLQRAAAAAVRDAVRRYRYSKAGAAALVDVDSGQVLARAQWPDYDPGTPDAWLPEVLAGDRRFLGSYGPWRDKTGVGGFYQTGSIFKVATSLAWARSGLPLRGRSCSARGATTFPCNKSDAEGPYFTRPDWRRPIHDSHRWEDGTVEITEGLEVSCNVFFGQLGLELGPEPFERLVADGLEVDNRRTIEPGEPGSRTLASTAFGQGTARMHVMEAVRMVATVGSGGIYRKCPPSMLLDAECEERPLVEDAARLAPILSGMYRVIEEERGTAHRFGDVAGVRVYAKTGTATDPGRSDEVPYGLRPGWDYPEHSWFVALAEPAGRDPCGPRGSGRLAVAAVVPRGGAGSGAALDVARRILVAAKDFGYLGD